MRAATDLGLVRRKVWCPSFGAIGAVMSNLQRSVFPHARFAVCHWEPLSGVAPA